MMVEWLPIAVRDRETEIDYLADYSPKAALTAADAIGRAVLILAEYPLAGRAGRIEGTREFIVARTPYIIAYRVEEHAVAILRLLHGAQRWPDRL